MVAFGGLKIAIIERDAFDRSDLQERAVRHQLRSGPKQRRVERALPQAA